MGESVMSLDEFKEALAGFWYNSLETIEPEYRKYVVETTKNLHEPYTLLANTFTYQASNILRSLSEIHTITVPQALDLINTVAGMDKRIAVDIAGFSSLLLKVANIETCKRVAEITLEKVNFDDSHLVNHLIAMAASTIKIGGITLYQELATVAESLRQKDPEIAISLVDETEKIMPQLYQLGPDHPHLVLDGIQRLVEKDHELAHQTFIRSHKTLTKQTVPDTDTFLLNSIHDPYSANLVGQLIDRKKYRKEYAQKCQGFY